MLGNGTQGFADGPAVSSLFNTPRDMASDAGGNIFVADTFNSRIRRIGTQPPLSFNYHRLYLYIYMYKIQPHGHDLNKWLCYFQLYCL